MNIEELHAQIEKEIEDRKNKVWFIRIPLNVWDSIWYRVFSRDLYHDIKWKLQRLFRGYSDCDTWNINRFTVEKLQPAIKTYVTYEAEHGHSLPQEFATDPAAWLNILRDIEYAFDWMHSEEFADGFPTSVEETRKAHYERVQRGCELFGRYLQSLWD